MKLRKQLPVFAVFFIIIIGFVTSGCLRNIWPEKDIFVTVDELPLADKIDIKNAGWTDGWFEVKRLKALSSENAMLYSLNFASLGPKYNGISPRIPAFPVPEWSIVRGALVVDGMIWEITDFTFRSFSFNKDIPLYAHRPRILSLMIRLLPTNNIHWIRFVVVGWSNTPNADIRIQENLESGVVYIQPEDFHDSGE